MKLSDIEKTSSTTMNNKMREKLGWSLNLDAMTLDSASNMMESIDNKLSAVRSSHKLHESQNNPSYVGMLMAKQILESYVAERKDPDKHRKLKAEYEKLTGKKAPAGTSTQAMQIIVDKAKRSKKVDEAAKPDFLDIDKDGDKKEPMKKAAKDGMSDKQAKYFGKKKVSEAELKVDEKAVSKSQQQAAAIAMHAPKGELKGASKEMAKMPKKELEKFASTKHKGLPKKVDESRLFEDELGQAQAMLAAKDMVDSMQDMIEDLSKMLNEQLPPLTDSIRTAIGSAQADSFKASASSTLSSLLTTVQSSREAMDQAVRTLSGEPGAVTVPGGAPGAKLPDLGAGDEIGLPDEEDDFAASDAATGGDLPLGREKR